MKEAKDMKEGWEYKKIGEVCDVIENISWSDVDDNTTYQYIDLSAVNRNTYSIDDTTTISKSDAPSRAKQIVKHKDILFGTTRPLLKRVCVVPVENDNNICSTGFCVLRPKNNMILSKWVFYQLLSEKYYNFIEPLQSGANYPAVSDRIVKSYIIPLPSLSEQQQIVSELDLLSGVIEKQKAQLEELDKLAQSIFYDMFGDPVKNEKGWETVQLEELCTKITDGTHDTPQRLKEGIKFITGKHIRPFYIDYNNSDFVTEEVHRIIYARCNPEYGDVLYTNIGAGVGNAALNIVNYEFSMKNVALIKLKSSYIKGIYLIYYLNNEKVKNSIIDRFTNGGAQIFLSLKSIGRIEVNLPPLALQLEFAAKMEAIEAMKAKVRQSLKEAETLFNERMDYYFN